MEQGILINKIRRELDIGLYAAAIFAAKKGIFRA